ncbi:MAG: energy-coupling factor ABC transporter permease [Dehalococcoidia bacterium]
MTGLAITGAPAALHAPDGFFALWVSLIGYVLAGGVIAYAVWQTNRSLNERMVPLMGVMAAFIFAAQMINFPVFGGTSGHLVGGALAAILLGPWAGILVVSAVVAVQALVFQDGGLVVLGLNVVNMAIVSCLVGYGVYKISAGFGNTSGALLARGMAAAFVSVEAAAIAATIQLVLSGTSPLGVALPAMVGVHALIGIGEGLITVGALAFVRAARPDLLKIVAQRA